jgi:hypothetical protein
LTSFAAVAKERRVGSMELITNCSDAVSLLTSFGRLRLNANGAALLDRT